MLPSSSFRLTAVQLMVDFTTRVVVIVVVPVVVVVVCLALATLDTNNSLPSNSVTLHSRRCRLLNACFPHTSRRPMGRKSSIVDSFFTRCLKSIWWSMSINLVKYFQRWNSFLAFGWQVAACFPCGRWHVSFGFASFLISIFSAKDSVRAYDGWPVVRLCLSSSHREV